MSSSNRRGAALFSMALLGLTLAPVLQHTSDSPRDGFPFSHYPMFSHARGDTYSVTHLLARDADGLRHPISYRLAGTGGFNQVRRQIRRAAREGRARVLCAEVAARLRDRGGEVFTEVQVVTSTFRLDEYFKGQTAPVRQEVHAACAV